MSDWIMNFSTPGVKFLMNFRKESLSSSAPAMCVYFFCFFSHSNASLYYLLSDCFIFCLFYFWRSHKLFILFRAWYSPLVLAFCQLLCAYLTDVWRWQNQPKPKPQPLAQAVAAGKCKLDAVKIEYFTYFYKYYLRNIVWHLFV